MILIYGELPTGALLCLPCLSLQVAGLTHLVQRNDISQVLEILMVPDILGQVNYMQPEFCLVKQLAGAVSWKEVS